eukprot:Gb_15430 [translate_table: standard]
MMSTNNLGPNATVDYAWVPVTKANHPGDFAYDCFLDYIWCTSINSPVLSIQVSSIIYVDSPAGTGFSYADKIDDYKTGDAKTASDAYSFILKWFEDYPEFLSNPFYVAGSSYGGVFVPTVAQKIVNGIEAGIKPTLNFKGYNVGNGFTDNEFDINSRVPFAYGMGLISKELYHELKVSCNGNYWNSSKSDCLFNMQAYNEDIAGISSYHILCLPCHYDMNSEEVLNGQGNILEHSKQSKEIEHSLASRRSMTNIPLLLTSRDKHGYIGTWPSQHHEDIYCYAYFCSNHLVMNWWAWVSSEVCEARRMGPIFLLAMDISRFYNAR